MATIQDLLRAKQSKPLQDLLDKYNQGQKFAEGGEVDDMGAMEDLLKKLKDSDKSGKVVPSEEVSSKASSFYPEDLQNHSESLKTDAVPVGEPSTPIDVKRPWELEAEKNALRTKNAVARNPVGEVKSSTLVGEPYSSEGIPVGESFTPNSGVAVRQNMSPEGVPFIGGTPSSTTVPEQLTGAQTLMNGLAVGGMNASGASAGMQALAASEKDPNSAVSKINNLIAQKQMANKLPVNNAAPEDNDPDPEQVKSFNAVANETPSEDEDSGATNEAARKRMMDIMAMNRKVGPDWHPPEVIPGQEPSNDSSQSSSTSMSASQPAPAPVSPLQSLMDAYKGVQDTHASDLKTAQQRANRNDTYANIARGLNQFTSGVTAMGGHGIIAPYKVDNSGIDAIQKTAQQPVEQYKENLANEKYDPNSAYSRGLQQFLAPTLQKIGINNVGQLSGEMAEKIMPFAVKQYDQKLIQDRLSQSNKDKAMLKTTEDQDKNYKYVQNLLEQTRGGVAKQAETNLLNLANAKSTVGETDPNKMDSRLVHLYVNEIAKVATGGAPTEAEIKALDSGTVTGELAKVWSKISNKPQPANAGEFIKGYEKYANDLEKNSQHTIADRYGRIINSNRDRISEKQAKNLEDQYIHRWDNEKAARVAEKSQSDDSKKINNQHKPGDIVTIKSTNKQYRVGADGDTLEAI